MSGHFANVPLRSSPPQAPAEAMGPQDFRVLGPFFVVRRTGGTHHGGDRDEALPRERDAARRARGAGVGDRDARPDGRPEVLRPVRPLAAHDAAVDVVRRVRLRRGPGLRRLLDPRLAGDQRVGHAARPRRDERDPRPVHRGADALAHLRDPRPADGRGVRQGPAARREARRGVSALDRDRRHGVHRPRVRVLRLRRGLVRARAERARTTPSTRRRATGTPASRASATRSARRRATSRRRRTTRCTTCGRAWC